MRAVFGLVLLIGMGLAGFAVYMVNDRLEQQERRVLLERQRAAAIVATTEVYAPSRAITYGEEIGPDDVQVIQYATDFLPEGVFLTEEDLFPRGDQVLRVAVLPMVVNEPILVSKVSEPGAPRGITALLSPGMRPFPLSNGMTAAYTGQLRVSDRVDMYWVGRVGQTNISRRVKQRLEIIAIEDADANGVGGRGVVLQVSEKDFADLQLLSSAGSLTITPVGTADTTVSSDLQDSSLIDLLDIEVEAAPEIVAEQEKCYITEREGGTISRVEIPCANQ